MASSVPPPARHLIVITADEMRGDCLAANRLNPDAQTPHLDALAARGVNLRPFLIGQTDKLRDAVFADGGHEAEMRGRVGNIQRETGKQRIDRPCPDAMARARMIRTDQHGLVVRETGDHQLYDLGADRWDLDNRCDDPNLTGVTA